MSSESKVGRVEIRPEVTMLSVLRHLNYKPWFALAEFIDNALQSYLANKDALVASHGEGYALKVEVRVESAAPGWITISDNAAGISQSDFPRAFRAAHAPIDAQGLSEFGMGMKSAACWFAQSWEVRTRSLGEAVERTISFDVREIVANRIEELVPIERPALGAKSYTVVSLRGLHHPPQGRTLGKIKSHLASIYRVFIRDGRLELIFNGERLSYNSPAVLKAKPYSSPGVAAEGSSVMEWRKEISLDFGSGQKVWGFAALRDMGSTNYAGFALFRRDRLIEGSHDETYRPTQIFKQTNSYPYQRLFGELFVEGFEVSHTKDGFRWEEYEEIFLQYLKEAIESPPLDMIAQAEFYRALPSKRTIEDRAVAATSSVVKHVEEKLAPLLADARESPVDARALPLELDLNELGASEKIAVVHDGYYKWYLTLRTNVDPAVNDWVSVAKSDAVEGDDERTRRLGIDLSLAHPFSVEFLGSSSENIELFLRFAAAIAVSLVLSEDATGDPPESTLHHLNFLLRGALSHKGTSNDNHHWSAGVG